MVRSILCSATLIGAFLLAGCGDAASTTGGGSASPAKSGSAKPATSTAMTATATATATAMASGSAEAGDAFDDDDALKYMTTVSEAVEKEGADCAKLAAALDKWATDNAEEVKNYTAWAAKADKKAFAEKNKEKLEELDKKTKPIEDKCGKDPKVVDVMKKLGME